MPLSDDSGIFLRNASGALLFLRDQARQDGNAGADEEADDAEEHIRRDLLAQEASLIFFLKPMIAPLFAFLFLREEITANMLLGICCFLLGSGIAILPGLIAQKKQRA